MLNPVLKKLLAFVLVLATAFCIIESVNAELSGWLLLRKVAVATAMIIISHRIIVRIKTGNWDFSRSEQ